MSRIKAIMKEKGITQKMLADKLGVSLSTVKTNLSGKHSMTINILERIANALDVEIWEFFVNPKDLKENTTNSARCPHCGKPIKLS